MKIRMRDSQSKNGKSRAIFFWLAGAVALGLGNSTGERVEVNNAPSSLQVATGKIQYHSPKRQKNAQQGPQETDISFKPIPKAFQSDSELAQELISYPLKAFDKLTVEWTAKLSSPPMRLGIVQSFAKACPMMPYLKHINAQYGVSDKFLFQTIVESRWDIFADPTKSEKKLTDNDIKGVFQLDRHRAIKGGGLIVTGVYDSRFHPLQSAHGSAVMLAQNYSLLKDFYLTVASYNGSLIWPYRVLAAKQKRKSSLEGFLSYLGHELKKTDESNTFEGWTSKYAPDEKKQFIKQNLLHMVKTRAVLDIAQLEFPNCYSEPARPHPYVELKTTRQESLYRLSKITENSKNSLMELNPHVLDWNNIPKGATIYHRPKDQVTLVHQ